MEEKNVETEKKNFTDEKVLYRNQVEQMLLSRGIKNRVPMLVWLRSQKQLAVDANMKRVEKAELEMSVLEEMIEGEQESENVTGGGDVT